MTDSGAHIWISLSPDFRNWGGHKLLLDAWIFGPEAPYAEYGS